MDTSLGLARSAESPLGSLAAVWSESLTSLASEAKNPEGIIRSCVRLSARELSIVLLMGHGLSNKKIARQLSITPETVKSHAKRIFWKLTVQTRAQAVYRASELGLI
jgi:ATP/maltotriose-dependent transcriptional regulator MalT